MPKYEDLEYRPICANCSMFMPIEHESSLCEDCLDMIEQHLWDDPPLVWDEAAGRFAYEQAHSVSVLG
jgi:predicted amidophosphoribosyltransferase